MTFYPQLNRDQPSNLVKSLSTPRYSVPLCPPEEAVERLSTGDVDRLERLSDRVAARCPHFKHRPDVVLVKRYRRSGIGRDVNSDDHLPPQALRQLVQHLVDCVAAAPAAQDDRERTCAFVAARLRAVVKDVRQQHLVPQRREAAFRILLPVVRALLDLQPFARDATLHRSLVTDAVLLCADAITSAIRVGPAADEVEALQLLVHWQDVEAQRKVSSAAGVTVAQVVQLLSAARAVEYVRYFRLLAASRETLPRSVCLALAPVSSHVRSAALVRINKSFNRNGWLSFDLLQSWLGCADSAHAESLVRQCLPSVTLREDAMQSQMKLCSMPAASVLEALTREEQRRTLKLFGSDTTHS